jgi:hypothetical protein
MGTDRAAAHRAKSIKSNFQLELEKWNELMNFEERVIIELKKYTDQKSINDARLKLVESFFKEELLKMLDIEKKLDEIIRKNIKSYQKNSIIFPTTFYQSVSKEMSGKGYENSSQFLLYLVDLKYKFCVFIKNKRFYSDDKKIEPFIKDGEENVYYTSAQIPGNFHMGMIVLAVYAVLLIIGAYFLTRFAVLNMRAVDAGSVRVPDEKPDYKKGKHAVIKVKNHKCKDLFYCLLAGRNRSIREKGFKGSIFMDGKDIVETQIKESFTYICDPQSLPPDSTVGDFLTFEARFFHISKEQKDKIMEVHELIGLKKRLIGRLESHERAGVTLALASMLETGKSEIYLFYNTALGVNAVVTKEFKDQLMELVKDNKLVIYLSTDLYPQFGDEEEASFFNWDEWNNAVEHNYELTKKNKKEEQQ